MLYFVPLASSQSEYGSSTPELWDDLSSDYEEAVFSLLQFADVRQKILSSLTQGNVLDMGCGPVPTLLQEIQKNEGIRLFGSDFSRGMLAANRKHFPNGGVHFVQADHRQLPFAGESFHSVFSVNSILPEERIDIDRTLSEVHRVLQPGGRFVAFLPAFETSLLARDVWKIPILVDEEQHREFDSGSWQCFFSRDDVIHLMQRYSFTIRELEQFTLASDEAIKRIQRIYGEDITQQLLTQHPLFEHFLVAQKADL